MIAGKGDPDVTTTDLDGTTDGRAASAEEPEAAASERGGSTSDDGDELPLDVVFDLLKNRRRRLVLRYLVEISETSTLSDLAEHIAAVENDKPEQALTSSERKRVYVCLYQCHLPKMDDAGVIEFESDRGTVELADSTEQLTQYLDTGEEEPEPDWPKYYAGLAVVGGGLFLAQRLVFPSDVLSGVLMGALVGLFANLALEHAYKRGVITPGRIRRRRPGATADAN